MTRDEIISMAKEAGMALAIGDSRYGYIERFAALVADAEREAIEDAWAQCVSSDLEHGVRWLNESAAQEWRKKYPAMAGFADDIRARGTQGESSV